MTTSAETRLSRAMPKVRRSHPQGAPQPFLSAPGCETGDPGGGDDASGGGETDDVPLAIRARPGLPPPARVVRPCGSTRIPLSGDRSITGPSPRVRNPATL